MKRICILITVLLVLTCPLSAQHARFHFLEVPLTDALEQIDQHYPEYKIHFIYSDLAAYTVTCDIESSTITDAIRQVVGFYPLKVLHDKRHFFIESRERHKSQLRGHLIDENHESVPYATIVLYNTTDSIPLTAGVSNENGDFVIPVDAQDVMMHVARMGYTPMQRHTPVIAMGDVVIQSNPYPLQPLTVTAPRPVLRISDQSLTLYVQGTALSHLARLADVLEYLPGLRRTDDGFTTMTGAPLFYINGRRVNTASEIEQLSPAQIARIQLIENGGPQYSSHGATVVHIHTVSPSAKGFNGQFFAASSAGHRYQHQLQGGIGWHSEQWDLHAGMDYANGQQFQDTKIQTTLNKQQPYTHSIQYSPRLESLQGTFSVQYHPHPSHLLAVNYEVMDYLRIMNYNQVYGKPGTFMMPNTGNLMNRDTWNLNYHPRHNVSFYYQGAIKSAQIQLDISHYRDYLDIQSIRADEKPGATTYQQHNGMGNTLWAEKLQLSLPLLHGQVQVGNEFTRTLHANRYQLSVQDEYHDFANRLEKVHSLFALYSHQSGTVNWQAGTRYEYSITRQMQAQQDDRENHYNGIYPYADVSLKQAENTWNLSYSMHSQRPAYSQLNNYSLYNNYMQFVSGNPNLKPAQHHQLAAQWQHRWLFARMEYQWVNRYIASSLSSNENQNVLEYINIPHAQLYSATLALTPRWGRWQMHYNLSLAGQQIRQQYDSGAERHFNRPLLFLSLHHQYAINSNWQLWGDVQLHNTGHVGTVLQHHGGMLNLGITHQAGHWNIRLSGNDLLATGRTKQIWYGGNKQFMRDSYNDTRRVELSIRYNFQPSAPATIRQSEGAGKSERQRFNKY